MSKYNKLYTALGVLLLMTACLDENFFTYSPVTIGDEVQFGASAYFDVAGGNTRTEYGNIKDGKVALNWVEGDDIEIVSPQSSVLRAVYAISGINIDEGFEDENDADGNSYTTMLRKETDEGIRWGEGYTIYDTDGSIAVDKDGVQQVRMHDFYALYPAIEAFTDEEISNTGVGLGIEADITNNTAVITGYMPNSQNPTKEPVVTDGNYTILPDMRYAFMSASTSVSGQVRTDTEGTTYEPQINLKFTPLVTALQFDITAGTIVESGSNLPIVLTAVSLRSDAQQICGGFTYDFNDFTELEEAGQNYNTITIDLQNSLETSISLTEGKACDVTFFLLPTADFNGLKLDITYTVNGMLQTKTATIGVDIVAKKKYYFDDLVMPSIIANGSSWLSALDDNTYVSQLSIPVAGNAFSYAYTKTSTETVDKAEYHKQQVVDYLTLWNQGVRGFEFATSAASASTSFGDEKFVCNGAEIESGITFDEAFGKIADMLEIEGCEKEFAVIIAKYQSYGGDEVTGGYAPQTYIDQLFNYLYNQTHISRDKIVQLNNRSTIGDLRGCIAVLVRPGDDDYMQYVNSTTTTDLTLPTVSGIDWSTKASLISDWGSAVDCWHRRYGDNYYAEGAFSSDGATGEVAFDPFSWETGSWCWIPETTPEGIQSSTELSNYSDYLVGSGGEVTLANSGDYEVTFTYQGGSHKLNIAGVDLLEKDSDGNYTIVKYSDYHYGYTGGNQYNKVYSLDNVDAGTYLLRIFGLTYAITEGTTETFDSYGNITWTCNGSAVTSGNGLTIVNETDYLTSNTVKLIYENNLMASSSSDASFNGTWPSLPTYSRDYAHYVNYGQSNAGTAWIQSWERVVPSAEKFNSGWYSGLYNGTGDYLWLRWPESVSEKKAMIDETYAASVATKGNTESSVLFINSLSGFFVTEEVAESYYPYVKNSYNMTDQGKGGDYASCAAELNTYFYNKIKNTSEGPYGLVILDFINAREQDFADIDNTTSSVSAAAAATASQKLTNLILMNNFKFPLAVKPSTVEEASLYLSDKLVDPSQPLQVKWVE